MNEYNFVINGNRYKVEIMKITEENALIEVNGTQYEINIAELFKPKTPRIVPPRVVESSIDRTPLTQRPGKDLSVKTIKSPLPGIIISVDVKEGDKVKTSQTLLKMEAMKMENDIQSPIDGIVKEIYVKAGESILEGVPLVKVE